MPLYTNSPGSAAAAANWFQGLTYPWGTVYDRYLSTLEYVVIQLNPALMCDGYIRLGFTVGAAAYTKADYFATWDSGTHTGTGNLIIESTASLSYSDPTFYIVITDSGFHVGLKCNAGTYLGYYAILNKFTPVVGDANPNKPVLICFETASQTISTPVGTKIFNPIPPVTGPWTDCNIMGLLDIKGAFIQVLSQDLGKLVLAPLYVIDQGYMRGNLDNLYLIYKVSTTAPDFGQVQIGSDIYQVFNTGGASYCFGILSGVHVAVKI